jgi:predicted N-acetyltransferase YhbS
MAVLPSHQRQGIGSRLVTRSLAILKAAGHRGILVLGHPAFYPRFGFVPAGTYGIRCAYDAPDEAFMALELTRAHSRVAQARQNSSPSSRVHKYPQRTCRGAGRLHIAIPSVSI